MRYYLIAGEASGDLHGSNLIKGLKAADPEAEFRCRGGDLMQQQGAVLDRHYKDSAVMGFVEVVRNLGKIRRDLRQCKADILRYRPDAVVLIDYPGFNFRIAEFASRRNIPVFYYIAPKVWAWKENRVRKLQRYVTRLFIIFPFEIEYFRKWGIDAVYRGNPLIDSIDNDPSRHEDKSGFLRRHALDPRRPLIALLAGSRNMEIRYLLPRMIETVRLLPQYQYVLAGAPSVDFDTYRQICLRHGMRLRRGGISAGTGPDAESGTGSVPSRNGSPAAARPGCAEHPAGSPLPGAGCPTPASAPAEPEILYLPGETYGVLRHADAAVISSGTASLEAALLNTPQVVCYGGNELSYQIAKRLVKLKYISLANLILDKPVFRELIQHDCTPQQIAGELERLLHRSDYRSRMLQDYRRVREVLGGRGASEKVAEAMAGELAAILRQTAAQPQPERSRLPETDAEPNPKPNPEAEPEPDAEANPKPNPEVKPTPEAETGSAART